MSKHKPTQSDTAAIQAVIDRVIDQATDTEAAAMLGAVVQRLEISDHETAAVLRDSVGTYTRELVRLAILEGARLGKATATQSKPRQWVKW